MKAVERPPFVVLGEINYICCRFIISDNRRSYEKVSCAVILEP